MKTLLSFIFLTMFVNADYINLSNKNHCIYDLVPYQNSTGFCYIDRSDSVHYCDKLLDLSDLINGYNYVNGECLLKNDLTLTGLTQSEWNYLLALLAHAIGFTMLLMISYLSVLIGRK